MLALKDSCSAPTRTISSMLNKEREEQITRNTKVIKSLLECVCFCAKQLFGDTATESDNKGNFCELVQFRAKTDAVLQNYLKKAPQNSY